MGLEFKVIVSQADEDSVSKDLKPELYVQELALLKASATAKEVLRNKNAVIISADTIVTLDGQILGKPKDEDDAFNMLSKLSGREHEVYTGYCVMRISDGKAVCGKVRTKVKFKALAAHYKGLCDEVIYDNLGSIFAVKKCGKENAKRVMVCAHMDEVGFMITEIHDNGLLSFIKIGDIADGAMYGSRVTLKTREGKELTGAIVADADTLEKGEGKKMKIDLGCASKKEVEDLGVFVGDSAVISGDFVQVQNRVFAKAWDNRFGCTLTVELLEALKDVELDYDLYIGASVMEEVGIRGGTSATGLIHPDMGIVLDCSAANDYAGKEDEVGKIGKGVQSKMYTRMQGWGDL